VPDLENPGEGNGSVAPDRTHIRRRNQEITPYVRNYRRSPLRSNNSIELSMTVCVIASTILGISMNPILAIAQDTLF